MPDEIESAPESAPDSRPRRSVRSFVVRAGRMTVAQERAWTELWPRYGIETASAPLDFAAIFGRNAPLTLEIGFGNGESLVALAAAHPDRDYLGVEVHRPGVGHLMLRAEELRLGNVRAICRDAVEVLQQCVPAGSLDEVPIRAIKAVPARMVIAVGNESQGLADESIAAAQVRFTIPLSRGVESLNVAATLAMGGVLLQ